MPARWVGTHVTVDAGDNDPRQRSDRRQAPRRLRPAAAHRVAGPCGERGKRSVPTAASPLAGRAAAAPPRSGTGAFPGRLTEVGNLMSVHHEQLDLDGLLQIGAATVQRPAQYHPNKPQADTGSTRISSTASLNRRSPPGVSASWRRVCTFSACPTEEAEQFRLRLPVLYGPDADRGTRDGRSLDEGRNALFQAPAGIGKTHLATALGLGCAERDRRLFLPHGLGAGVP